MPPKDPDRRKAYNRAYYALNREAAIARVRERKHTTYAGVCRNCGGPTVGVTKSYAPEWCAKPKCASAQRKGKVQEAGPTKEKNDDLEVPA